MKHSNNDVSRDSGAAHPSIAVRVCLTLALSVSLPSLAHAEDCNVAPKIEVGHSVGAWLELQRSNAQAAPTQPMLGAEAGYARRRYMKSFETPIPSSFGSSVNAGGSGSSSSGSLNSAASTGSY